ncbi:MAG: PAS domain-containing sensor histidine kinase [Polyangiaceae bacterium]
MSRTGDFPLVTVALSSTAEIPALLKRARDVCELIDLVGSSATRLTAAISEATRQGLFVGPLRVRFGASMGRLVVGVSLTRPAANPWRGEIDKLRTLVDQVELGDLEVRLVARRPIGAADIDPQKLARLGEELERRSSASPERELARQHRELLSTMNALRRAEKLAQAEALEKEQILGLIPAIVWSARADGHWTFVSQRWAERTGHAVEAALGQSWMTMVASPEPAELHRRWRSAIEAGAPFAWNVALRTSSGAQRWHRMRGIPITSSGSLDKWLGILVDIHASKEREEQAERVSAFMKRMIGVVGHDLRAPLSVVVAASAALRLRSPGADESLLQRIEASTERAGRMIADLLDYTRAELGGAIPVQPRRCDLAPCLRALIEQSQTAHPKHSIVLSIDGDLTAEADEDRVVQALGNLIENAATHASRSHPILVEATADEAEIRLSVQNHGPVIPEDKLLAMFEPFQQHARAKGGLGLGLFIVAAIAKSHGGRVSLSSSEADGTRSTIVLPRQPPPAPPE